MYYIYILRCEGDKLYTGITNNLEKRFKDHQEGRGAKFTKINKPLNFEKIFCCANRSEATKIEFFIKKQSRATKEKIIANQDFLIEKIKKNFEIEIFCKKSKKIFDII